MEFPIFPLHKDFCFLVVEHGSIKLMDIPVLEYTFMKLQRK